MDHTHTAETPADVTRRGILRAGAGIAAGIAAADLVTPALARAGRVSGSPNVVGMSTGRPDPQMQAVLDQLAALHPLPLPSVTPEVARQLPTVADAVQGVISTRGGRCVEPVGSVNHVLIPGPSGQLLIRVYTPAGTGPFPVAVYFHGGGFVIANLDTYDASCRALVNAAGCIVLSVA